ncbi:hypothetical protein NP233_g12479 [Leucocoprinus birnbaumii]|uniref:Peptidase A1 domain-containing protein n=1 Tax=Leucocoprinus birnbaumii TaxID=56174 RepID=A0AAD5YPY9_9AGAR|nr:hypothetical protein NP233_g12479 [Leucocoprinus birnbaumii]
MPSPWKGKQKARLPRADSDGGTTAGVVLNLTLVGTGIYDAAYTVPVSIGQSSQQLSLQVDTGSSDLWVASTSCSSSACGATSGHNYDPSASGTSTDQDFKIQYLAGSVSGPIYWDRFDVGGYSVEYQALAAAASVSDETLAPNYSGILGLALPLNSIIAETIPPVTNNEPDGAAWASNLFSITPTSNAPSSRFLSLSLSRPGSDRIPSLLGIGKHPPDLVKDPSQISYAATVSDSAGSLFWKTSVRDITVWVDGQPRRVEIGRSNTGAVFPSAVIDSGVPFIFTTSRVANGIYGAIDIHPAQDGNYYVPCRTPLNLSITLDNRAPLSIHPLDLTAEPPQDNNAQYCIGLIQAADAQLSNPTSDIGDMILGVPFMRNVYTVMAYDVPFPNGTFPIANASVNTVQPRLGLMSLTDPSTALSEFNTVRVLNQPLSGGSVSSNTGAQTSGKKLSVGIIVLIALLGFFTLCCALFVIRWLLYRKKFKQQRDRDRREGLTDDKRELAYQLAHRSSAEYSGMPSEDTLRVMRYEAYTKKERTASASFSSRLSQPTPDEFGVHNQDWNDDTLVQPRSPPSPPPAVTTLNESPNNSLRSSRHSRTSSSPERYRLGLPGHQRTPSELPTPHQRTTSIATPLLSDGPQSRHDEDDHTPYHDDDTHR